MLLDVTIPRSSQHKIMLVASEILLHTMMSSSFIQFPGMPIQLETTPTKNETSKKSIADGLPPLESCKAHRRPPNPNFEE